MPTTTDKAYSFTEESVRRIVRSVLRTEAEFQDRPPRPPPNRPSAGRIQLGICKTNSTITARSGTTLGTGTASLYTKVDGVLTDTGDDVDVVNFVAASLVANTYAVWGWFGDQRMIVSAEC